MLLSCQVLTDVCDVNKFQTGARQVEFTAGDTLDVYFQLVDLSVGGRRFMPATGATLMATVDNIDDARKVTRACSQPFSNDPSIWVLNLLAADGIKGTNNLKLVLTEPGPKVTNALVKNLIRVYPQNCL